MMCQLDTPDCPTLRKIEKGEIAAFVVDGCEFEFYEVSPRKEHVMETTVIHVRDQQPGDVYIGRVGKGADGYFGNPFRLQRGEPRGTTLARYRQYFERRVQEDAEFKQRVLALRGKRLACFCKPHACHGDVIAAWLNGTPAPSSTKEAPASAVTQFQGPYRFLSNFWGCRVGHYIEFEGHQYPSVEHAFQAAKTLDEIARERIRCEGSPSEAKRLGRQVQLRPHWDDLKVSVMRDLLHRKFADPELAQQLRETGEAELIEGNYWHDQYWGNCTCLRRTACRVPGKNWLGRLLQEVRATLA